jgi:hypothetical protein
VWLSGCAGASDFLSKDAEWFSRPSRIFGNDLTVGAGPLSQRKPVAPEDMIGADGSCVGAGVVEQQPDPAAPGAAPAAVGTVGGPIGIDSTECDVVRAAGMPDQTDVTANERNERMVVLTYLSGPRPGIYRFTAGRLTSMERAPGPPPAPPRAQKRRS